MRYRPKIKFCGIRTYEALEHSLYFNVDFIGINLVASSKRYAQNYRELINMYFLKNKSTILVIIFQNEDLNKLTSIINSLPIKPIVNLHGNETPEYCVEVKKLCNVEVWKAINNLDQIDSYKTLTDMLLFDSANPGSGTKINILPTQIDALNLNYGVAGGINKNNIENFFNNFSQAQVFDIASGIEENEKYNISYAEKIINLRNNYAI